MELTVRLSFILHFILFYFYFLAAPKSQGLAHICHTRYITHLFLNSKLLQIIRKLNESATHHVKSLLRIFSWRKQKKMHRPDPFLHRKYPKATGTTSKFKKQFKLESLPLIRWGITNYKSSQTRFLNLNQFFEPPILTH